MYDSKELQRIKYGDPCSVIRLITETDRTKDLYRDREAEYDE